MTEERKIIVLLGDGMADLPIDSLGGRTPLQYASTPNMDRVASEGITGMAKTVPDGMQPGSDTANLSVFGYNPEKFYTGRAPLEALNMGIELGPNDAAFRCNLVNLSGDVMADFSSDHIDSDFTRIIIDELRANIKIDGIEFYPGVSYRNIVIWRNFPFSEITSTTPPHDITDREIQPYLPEGGGADVLRELMALSSRIISESAAVKEAEGKYRGNPTSIWLWGGGRKPAVTTLEQRFGLNGYTISAVDLIHGIGRAAGLSPYPVNGATGYIDTNYSGKSNALKSALKKGNFVYLHVEAPDESGHEGSLEHKLRAIEDFDSKIVGPVLETVSSYDKYSLLIMPDHPTPVSIRTHTSDPVPFCMQRTGGWTDGSLAGKTAPRFNEVDSSTTGLFIDQAHRLLEIMINGTL